MNQEKLSKLKSGVQIGGKVRCLFRYIYTVKNPDITKMKNNLTVAARQVTGASEASSRLQCWLLVLLENLGNHLILATWDEKEEEF